MFDNLIGQSKIKSTLSFFVKGGLNGGAIPPILLTGARGLGKTEFARHMAKALKRPFLEVNCSTIKNNAQFFDQIFLPVVMGNEITLLLDECHALPKDLQEAFLTVFNVEKHTRKHFEFQGSSYEFDFTKQTYIFATTDQNKIRPALKDRFEEVDFSPYNESELGQILESRLDWVEFADGIVDTITDTLRGNARAAVKRAKNIELYCEAHNVSKFDNKAWLHLCSMLNINPNGLTPSELQVLSLLKRRGPLTLTTLSAATDIPRSTLQNDVERYLLRKGYLVIDGTRRITGAGELALSKA